MTSACRRPRRAPVLVSVLAVAGLALAACGDDSDGDTADEGAEATTEESTASLPT